MRNLANISVVGLVYDRNACGYREVNKAEKATSWAVYRKFHDRTETVDRHELGKPTKTYYATHAEATAWAIIAAARIAAHINQGDL